MTEPPVDGEGAPQMDSLRSACARVECIGVNPLDLRRVDVAVDITPCLEPLKIEMVIVGPDGAELSSILIVQSRASMLDKVMHLRRDAEPGEHTLYVGLFYQDRLVHHAARKFTFPVEGLDMHSSQRGGGG